MKKNMIEIGISEKPHGIKGAFTFKLFHPEDSFLDDGMKVFLVPKSPSSSIKEDGDYFEISNIAFGNKVICYLKGINDRNITEDMLPFSIQIPREEFPDLDDDEVYIGDLIGLTVIDHKSKKEIGEIIHFYENGAQVIFVISENGKKIDIPFVEHFFPVVDVENGIVEINMPIVVSDGRR